MPVTLADNASDWVRAMFRSRVTLEDLQNTTKIIFETVSFDVDEIVDMDGRVYVPQRTCRIETHHDGWGCVTEHCGACGADLGCDTRNRQNYCPCCGARVVEE